MRQLSVVAATAALALVLVVAASASRVSLPTFSIVIPKGWVWRAFPGIDGTGAEFSNWSLASRRGFSPEALPARAFIIWVNPFREHGSTTEPTLAPGDFLRADDPARPPGHAHADHAYCARSGRCFEISFEYGSSQVPDEVLLAVNRALRSIRVAPLPHPRRGRKHPPRPAHKRGSK